jgi:hypothetical protein
MLEKLAHISYVITKISLTLACGFYSQRSLPFLDADLADTFFPAADVGNAKNTNSFGMVEDLAQGQSYDNRKQKQM